jgi:hypothetical protein
MVREWTWRHLISGYRLFAAHRLWHARSQLDWVAPVVQRATPPRLCPASEAASAQTTIDGWPALNAAPITACQSGSALFCFDGTQSVKYQLNDAVVLERA